MSSQHPYSVFAKGNMKKKKERKQASKQASNFVNQQAHDIQQE